MFGESPQKVGSRASKQSSFKKGTNQFDPVEENPFELQQEPSNTTFLGKLEEIDKMIELKQLDFLNMPFPNLNSFSRGEKYAKSKSQSCRRRRNLSKYEVNFNEKMRASLLF
jgi:hypothetical protein